jgi:hypothetical protein
MLDLGVTCLLRAFGTSSLIEERRLGGIKIALQHEPISKILQLAILFFWSTFEIHPIGQKYLYNQVGLVIVTFLV